MSIDVNINEFILMYDLMDTINFHLLYFAANIYLWFVIIWICCGIRWCFREEYVLENDKWELLIIFAIKIFINHAQNQNLFGKIFYFIF